MKKTLEEEMKELLEAYQKDINFITYMGIRISVYKIDEINDNGCWIWMEKILLDPRTNKPKSTNKAVRVYIFYSNINFIETSREIDMLGKVDVSKGMKMIN